MCSGKEREQNAAAQQEEIEVLQVRKIWGARRLRGWTESEGLQAIFADEFRMSGGSFTLAVPGPYSIVLQVHLPRGYPSTDAPVAVVKESLGLTNAQRDQITGELVRVQC
jgi:hypothetical protein